MEVKALCNVCTTEVKAIIVQVEMKIKGNFWCSDNGDYWQLLLDYVIAAIKLAFTLVGGFGSR